MATQHDPAGARRPFWRPGRSGPGWLWLLLGLIPVAVVVAIVFMVLSDDAGTPIAEGPHAPATINTITQDPEQFYGDEVTVSGEVRRTLSPHVFTVSGTDGIADRPLLVVGMDDEPLVYGRTAGAPVDERDAVRATGTLREFRIAEVEAELGIDIEEGALSEFEGQPVVLAGELIIWAPGAARP